MVGTFLALALGQLLIARADIKAAASFNAIVALFAVALIMVTAARAEPPRVGASDGVAGAGRGGRDRGCRGGDSHGAGDGYPQPGANQRNAL
jgi:hypothetical protein